MEAFIKVPNGTLWTEKRGKGIPTLLISGGPGTCNYLEPIADLIDDVCEVIMFDPRGCGRSTYDVNGYDLETCLLDIETIRNEYGYKQWMVIGHSWGADVGLAYALSFSHAVLGYVSISGTGIQNDRDWKEAYKRRKEVVGEKTPLFEYDHNKVVHRSLIHSWRDFIKRPTLLKEISQLTIPSLFVYGEKDIRPSWSIQQIANSMVHSEYVEIEGAEHYMWFSHKDELKKVLTSFIQKM